MNFKSICKFATIFTILLFSLMLAPIATATTSSPVYRFRNDSLGGSAHFYTIEIQEVDTLLKNIQPDGIWPRAFKLEGIAFEAVAVNGVTCSTGEPVYRFRNERYGSAHFYTIDKGQYNQVKNNSAQGGIWEGVFVDEGIAFCAFTNPTPETSPVHRFRNDSLGGSVHFYTIDTEQYNTVLQHIQPGKIWEGVFAYEGIAFYAYEVSDENKLTTFSAFEDFLESELQKISDRWTFEPVSCTDNAMAPSCSKRITYLTDFRTETAYDVFIADATKVSNLLSNTNLFTLVSSVCIRNDCTDRYIHRDSAIMIELKKVDQVGLFTMLVTLVL